MQVLQDARSGLNKEIADAENRLLVLRRARRELGRIRRGNDLSVEVRIISAWKNLGNHHADEQDVTVTCLGLDAAAARAIEAFRSCNNRSDVQGALTAAVSLGDGEVKIPINLSTEEIRAFPGFVYGK
jgi:hypothetical protein